MAASPVGFSQGWKQQAKVDSCGLGLVLNKVIDCAVACLLCDIVPVFWKRSVGNSAVFVFITITF